jgi:hypothetical protein
MRKFAFAKLAMATVAVAFGTVSISPVRVHADALAPLQITPLCADASTNTAYWNVNNFNSSDITFNWKNIDDGATGSFTATSGLTKLATEYQQNQNNTTHFSYPGFDGQTNSSNTPCAATAPVMPQPPVACIDGSDAQNIVFNYLSDGDVQVHTKNNQPLCNDIQLYFSSYIMPANYDGNGFYGNVTAYPQPIYSSDNVVLTAGTDGSAELQIDLPDACNNVQTDLYYGPEITTVGANGHGTQNIQSYVYTSDESCAPASTGGDTTGATDTPKPGMGGGDVIAPVTPAPVVVPTVAPGMGGGLTTTATSTATPATAQLANTGQSTLVASLIATVLAFSAGLIYSSEAKINKRSSRS